MKITKQLRGWLEAEMGLEAGASDEAANAKCAEAMTSSKLSPTQLVELCKETTPGTQLQDTLATLTKSNEALLSRLDKLEASTAKAPALNPLPEGTDTSETLAKYHQASSPMERLLGGSTGEDDVRVKGAHERYNQTKGGPVTYPAKNRYGTTGRAGQEAYENDMAPRHLQQPSQAEKAASGAYFKFMIQSQLRDRCPRALRMTEHDTALLKWAMHELEWGGVLHGVGGEDDGAITVKNRKLSDFERKALLDDSTSDGLEIAPIAFDDMIITIPVLMGQFYPFVDVVPITRGRRIEGGSIGNVTISSGGADGTAIPLFNTTSFISAFDTNIYVAQGAIEIGLDFLSDSPVDVAGIITTKYGEQLLNWLDTQICTGDGTTEPEGIIVASGTVSVASANGAGGPPTVGDYEGLLFGVTLPYRQGTATERIRYGGNETAYRRARGIAVGATDQRRVFGMDHENYQIFGHPYGINASFTNRQQILANFARYRMYRRLGMTMRATTEGQTLVRANLLMLSMRARFGGQLTDGAAAAYQSDGQS